MALVIRLRQQGRNNRRCFRLVVANKRSPRDGKYLEKLGWYDPFMQKEVNYAIDAERVQHWLSLGAEISERAKVLVSKVAPEIIKKLQEKSSKKKKKAAPEKEAAPKKVATPKKETVKKEPKKTEKKSAKAKA
jgi:small subunit ribosomal protein S16